MNKPHNSGWLRLISRTEHKSPGKVSNSKLNVAGELRVGITDNAFRISTSCQTASNKPPTGVLKHSFRAVTWAFVVRQSATSKGRNLSRAVECMNVERLLPSPSVPSGSVRRAPLSRCIWPDSKTSFFIALIITYTTESGCVALGHMAAYKSKRKKMLNRAIPISIDNHATHGGSSRQLFRHAVTLFEASIKLPDNTTGRNGGERVVFMYVYAIFRLEIA